MRVVFVTHNDLGLACLEELDALGADVRAIYTRPSDDAVADQTAFDGIADEIGADRRVTESVDDADVVARIEDADPDLLFVVGWSRLVDEAVIEIPSVAALGMHPAPLPRGRGRAPIAWTLIKGLEETALSFFHLEPAADAGDLVGRRPIDVSIEDDAASLFENVVQAGRELIREYYPRFEAGDVPREPQDEDRATWWPRRRPEHGLVDWTQTPRQVYDWIRGQSHPYPGAYSVLNGQRVTIWAARPPSDEPAFVVPGEIAAVDGDALRVGAWEGCVDITTVQPAGGGEMPASELVTDGEHEVGDRFDRLRDRLD